ncbi:bpX6 domain-containing protein [Corallococcus sp. BB11-1]|uniref:bpX6 domain-containing protein n=1 Tax=Corallococcus sp. BB11-1 TaxID=2996783 RepID=UPI00226EEE0C|nr:bpX6 domain-containing protein [Corallococcus sp. BB11-1]MCY1030386.1 bpX6 domain-containing protein [Corallococcus sp. BB11-1]
MSAVARTLRPRAHVHRGTVVAVAYWFHSGTLGVTEARRRMLAAWAPGATAWVMAGGYLLRLATPRQVAVEAAPGLPLVLESGVLTSAPLTAKERQRLAPPPGAIVLVLAGVARVLVPGEPRQVDPGTWLDVSGWQRVAVKGLGAPPPAMRHALPPVPPPTRESFGPGVPALAPEAQRMLARMEGREIVVARKGLLSRLRHAFGGRSEAAPGSAMTVGRAGFFSRMRAALFPGASVSDVQSPASHAHGAAPGWWRRLFGQSPAREGLTRADQGTSSATPASPGWFARLLSGLRGSGAPVDPHASPSATPNARQGVSSPLMRALRSWLRAFGGAPRDAGGGPGPGGAPSPRAPSPPSGPGALARMKSWMLENTPLGRLMLQRKSDYLRHLLDLFEQGNVDEALRHAIPLGKDPDAQAQLALGLPARREELRIQPQRGGGAQQVFGGGAVFDTLRQRYRDLFRRLEREGRIDEAAFVLAELLNATEEAVSFLERHGRLRLAAELAEGRDLPAGLVVRQWLLAKDVARAVAIARRGGVFADAVLRLEKSHPREAEALRLLWADSLAEAGDWARAVEAVWPVTSARHLAKAWVERGVRAGGASGAKLLVHQALGFPEGFVAARANIEALLEDEAPERAPERFAFATELLRQEPSDAHAALLTPTVRALLRDRARDLTVPLDALIKRLRNLREPAMAALRADLSLPAEPVLRAWSEVSASERPPIQVRRDRNDAGAHAVHDAVVLPGRRVLLALGEAGARLVGADGRTLAWFDVPAFSLVLSSQGDRALALARRGDVWRLSRLDLVERRASRWCDAELGAWAPTYDGDRWFIAVRDTVVMVDALAQDLRSLWRVPQVGGTVLELAADARHLSFLVLHLTGEEEFQRLERWGYDLEGGPTLRQRASLPGLSRRPDIHALTPDGEAAAARRDAAEDEALAPWPFLPSFVGRRGHPLPSGAPSCVGVVLSQGWSAARFTQDASHTVNLRDLAGHLRGAFLFSGVPPQVVRLTDDWCLVHDLLGRVVWVDLHSGAVHAVPVE